MYGLHCDMRSGQREGMAQKASAYPALLDPISPLLEQGGAARAPQLARWTQKASRITSVLHPDLRLPLDDGGRPPASSAGARG